MPMKRFETLPYVRWGLSAGATGAAVVAVFFLVVDLVAGRPLATPTALGAALFLGEPFDLERGVDALMITGYTALHTGVFVALAAIAAAILFGRKERPATGPGPMGLLALVFFAGTTLLSLGFRAHSGVSLWGELGPALVTAANVLAAVAMAAVLGHGLRTRWTPPHSLRERVEAARGRAPDAAR